METLNTAASAGVPAIGMPSPTAIDQNSVDEIVPTGNTASIVQLNTSSIEPSEILGDTSFHDTQGSINVNNNGQLQFNLPIALPPAIKSVAPQVNLIYTSGSGNGIAGYGWTITGVTGISRMGRSIDRDGGIQTIQYDFTDYYMLGGQRLMLKSGVYGKDDAEYVTEKYSNTKIRSIGTNPEQNGPAYFEVTFEDGSQALYGSSADARTAIEYNIVSWQDAHGNYISYSYVQGDNVAVIDRIEWGGNEHAGTSHFNSITFNYMERELIESSYVRGILFKQNNLLQNIEVRANGNIFKTYEMVYEKDDHNNRYQFLKSITERNALGEAANPVVFDYKKSKPGEWRTTSITNDKNAKLLYGDFDGDGKIDVIKYADAFRDCLNYENIYHGDNGADGDDFQTGYWESYCTEPVDYPAGIYHFSSVLDNNQPKQVYIGSAITKAQLENAKVFNLINAEGEILNRQGFFIYETVPSTTSSEPGRRDLIIKGYSMETDSISGSKQLKEEFVKIVPAELYDQTVLRDDSDPNVSQEWNDTFILDVKEHDLDGDGISELIFVLRDTSGRIEETGPSSEPIRTKEIRYRYLIVQPNETEVSNLAQVINIYYPFDNFFDGKALVGDFDGDGCVDFISFTDLGECSLLTIKKNNLGKFYAASTYYPNIRIEGLRDKAIVGDFTGDGKTDIMVPQAVDSEQWKLYISTGSGFRVQVLDGFQLYKEDLDFRGKTHLRNIKRQYFAQDLNKDGKADLIAFYSHIMYDYSDKGCQTKFMILYHENKGMDARGNVVFEKRNIDGSQLRGRSQYKMDWYPAEYDVYWTDVKPYASNYIKQDPPTLAHFSPLIGDFRINNFNEDILVFREGSLIKYSHYSVADETYITSITQGGIDTEIQYDELDPKVNPGFYASVKKEKYPYVEMDRLSRTFVVSQLRQDNRKQDFRYRGFVAHVLGKGMLGFRQSARSSWYTDQLLATKIWTGSEMDPLNEGLPIKEWSVRTSDDNELIFPKDLSLDNAQLLSFKSIVYDRSTPSLGVTAIVPIKTVSKDFLKDIVEEHTVVYGDYYLPASTATVINNGYATTSTVLAYMHNLNGTGKDYFVGRPISKLETIQAYADTKQQKEEYAYTNHLLASRKTYNRNGSGWVQESYAYDLFGNIVEKVLSNSSDSMTQTERTQYDPKGRFVIKKTDNLNLETLITYNDLGQVLTQIDPLGNMLTSVYDGWGKLLSSEINLEGVTTFTYEKMDDKGTKVSKYEPDGMASSVFTNKLGQQVKTRQRGFNKEGSVIIVDDIEITVEGDTNTRISVLTVYDDLGRKIRESEPHRDGSPEKWNNISYDDSVFPVIVTATSFNGKQVTTRQEGRTTIVEERNGYLRSSKKIADPLGNIIISEDKGGTISFSFNAAGDQIGAQYGDNIVRTDYDVWGRRSLFEDPSNGVYRYEYNGLGQAAKEISPKGYKEYRYNAKGQLVDQTEKSIQQGLTDKTINYRYDGKGLLVEQAGTSGGEQFKTTFIYDSYGRLLENREESYGRIYMQRDIEYDDKSRVVSYAKSLESNAVQTVARIQHIYDAWSGILSKIINADTGLELWRIQESNAGGQVLRSRLGASSVSNAYNEHNLLTEILHQSNAGQILHQKYTFDAIRNELKDRIRTGNIALTENFSYDNNNRLIEWTNPATGALSANSYDIQGRIVDIDNVGTVRFDNAGEQYRPSKVMLNTAGKQHYANDLIQEIVYNENNDPLQIKGNQGNVTFDYGLGPMRQRVLYSKTTTDSKINESIVTAQDAGFTKFYSADGSFEVIRNNSTGQEKHLIYIGSTPYESNIVCLKDYSESAASYKFLHKDYLGSILAISDSGGTLLEERHFDAWGNLTHGNMQLLDRGYTSHEHFAMVGIIHMNGRLYDPFLRRFLNADEHIQDMFNTQNYNKYGYVLNNPLMYNDPSGEFFFGLLAIPLIKAIFIGAAIGLAAYTVGLAVSGNIGMWNLGGALKATLFGAVSGAITFGIGSIFKAAASTFGNALLQAGAHGLSQGVLGLVQGQNFLSSAASGVFGSLGVYGWGKAMNGIGLGQFSQSTYGMIGFGAISGGVGAELTGGNFWQGVITGGIVAGLNHAMHKMGGPGDPKDKEQITKKKIRIKITRDIYDQLKKADDIVVKSMLDGKSIFGKYGTVLDFLDAGGEIYLVNLEYKGGVLTKAEYQFKMANTVLNKGASIGAGLALETGFTLGSRAGIYGMLLGTAVGATVDGAFYISAKGEQWLNRWGRYIRYQTIGIIENSIR